MRNWHEPRESILGRDCGDLEFQSRSVSGKWGVRHMHTPLPKPPSHGNHSGKMEEMEGGRTDWMARQSAAHD